MRIWKKLGKLSEVTDLRSVWKDEARDFTPWLAREENIALLGEELGIEIEVEEIESPVGPFSVDIFAHEAGTGRKIIIENQLEETNHTHLGQIVTYAAGKNAQIMIWIVKKAREEHQASIAWLNNYTDSDIRFFLLEIRLYRIDDSRIAPFFSIIEQPNEWTKEARRPVEILTTGGQFNLEYWTAFEKFCNKDPEFLRFFHKVRKPGKENWMAFGIGTASATLEAKIVAAKNYVSVYIYIPRDIDLFYRMQEHQKEIEQSIGAELDWYRNPDNISSRISLVNSFPVKNREEWDNQFRWIINSMIAFKLAFQPYLK